MFLVWLGFCCALITVHAEHSAIKKADFNAISSGLNQFSLSLYRSVSQAKNWENVLISPFSVSVALGMVLAGAKGNTAQELKSALRLPADNDDIINNFFANLMDNMKGNGNITLDVANKIYLSPSINMLRRFQRIMTNSFKSASENINFGEPNAYKIINKWVEEQTKNKIKDLLQSDDVDSLTTFALVNAVYFKANWLTQFKKEQTEEKPFFLGIGDQKVNVSMMRIQSDFRYGELQDLDAKILELPYSGRNMSFFIVLPNEINGLKSLERNLLSRNTLQEIIRNMRTVKVDAEIPKFKLESLAILVPNLEQMGITDLFNDGRADLSGMAGGRVGSVSNVIHKTFLEVNEEGSEAAAATAILGRWRVSGPIPKPFVANHPFLFFIRDNAINSILFIGRLVDPTK